MEDRLREMTHFSTLEYRHLGPNKWLLTKPFMYFGDLNTVVVPSGFVTDLDSVPRVPFLYAALKGRSIRAATIHDYMYKSQLGKKLADRTFYKAMGHENIPNRRRLPIYWGVVLFGKSSYSQYGNNLS
jgi:hypothetical protein